MHFAATGLASMEQEHDRQSLLASVFDCRNILHDARAAIVGNVTPRTAVAAALLEIQAKLHLEGRVGYQGVFTAAHTPSNPPVK